MNRLLAALIGTVLASGCASHPEPIVDTKGVDMSRYEDDLGDCEAYASQVRIEKGVAKGAVAGGAVGAASGAVVGDVGTGAGLGAIGGAARSERRRRPRREERQRQRPNGDDGAERAQRGHVFFLLVGSRAGVTKSQLRNGTILQRAATGVSAQRECRADTESA